MRLQGRCSSIASQISSGTALRCAWTRTHLQSSTPFTNVELFADAPEEVLLIGIVGEGYDSGCSLSAPVAASCTRVVEEVLRELDRLGVSWQERKVPLDPGIWWTPVDELEHRMTGDRLSQDANRITS